MLNNKLNLIKNSILGIGLILFLYSVYLDRFEISLIIAFSAILIWMGIGLLWLQERNYKQIGNTLIGAGLIISLAIFFNFGVEPTPIPIGGFVFNSDGIYKAISLLFLFIISGFLFRYLDELVPEDAHISPKDFEEEPKPEFVSDDWELISEDDILTGDYEVIKD